MLATTFSTNVFGTAVLTNAALPVLEKAAFPRVINVSSSLGSLTQMSGDVEPGFRMFVR
jgi:NAD(P)-dependent dehydrogenase (short-subunit alcohol dehydrogenase family)